MMNIDTNIKKIQDSLLNKKFVLVPFLLLGVIVMFKPIFDLFGIRYTPIIGISVLTATVLLSIILILIALITKDVSGIVTFFSSRKQLSPDYWQDFFIKRKQPRVVYLLGQSLSKTFNDEKRLETFISWCNKGTEFKIILLSYKNTEISQLQKIGKGIKNTYSTIPNKILINKIENTSIEIHEKFISRVSDIKNKPKIRYAACNLPFSLNAIDNDMLITFYGTNVEADEQPTLLIRGENSESYLSFLNEFVTIWNNYSKVVPEVDPVLKNLKKQWYSLITLSKHSSPIPLPLQAIIFPTYRCEEQCEYCMFKLKRNNNRAKSLLDMELNTFQKILDEIKLNKINYIEISGGGEPFEHPKFKDFLKLLAQLRAENTNIKIGILTNGLHLNDYEPDMLLFIFNDYIRISRYEKILLNKENQDYSKENADWEQNILALLKQKRNNNVDTKIGIKYLLNKKNYQDFVSLVQNDFNKEIYRSFDHYRFRAERRIDNSEITKIEHDIYYSIQKHKIPNIDEKLSISLTNYVYPTSFKCWISPMSCVFDPSGSLNICCNYVHDEQSKVIGNINNDSFSNLWNNNKHNNLRKKLERNNCDKPIYTNCRFAEIQDILDNFSASIGDLN